MSNGFQNNSRPDKRLRGHNRRAVPDQLAQRQQINARLKERAALLTDAPKILKGVTFHDGERHEH